MARGVSDADVAKAAGCSRAAVYKILVQHGQDAARAFQPMLDRSAAQDAEINRLRSQGMSVKRIADALGATPGLVRDVISGAAMLNRMESKQ